MKVWMKRIFSGLGILLLIGILYAAFAPLPQDEVLPPEKWGAGSSSVEPAYSGLQRDFPATNETDASRQKVVHIAGRSLADVKVRVDRLLAE